MQDNPIKTLYEQSVKYAEISSRRSKRNKLSDRDVRHASILMTRSESNNEKITLLPVLDTLNMNRKQEDKVSRQTLSRKLKASDIQYSSPPASVPREVKPADLPRWLRRRRGWSAKFIKSNTDDVIMVDEALFGFRKRIHMREKLWCIRGRKRAPKYIRKAKGGRVSVFAGCGPKYFTNIYIFKSGNFLTEDDYAKIMDNGVYNEMLANDVHIIYSDNCSIHKGEKNECVYMQYSSRICRKFLIEYSPDTNWQEKVWANMNDIVYEKKKEYDSIDKLTEAIQAAWFQLMTQENYRNRLADDAKQACRKIINTQGYLVHW